jgi:hypothetical protein
MDKKWFYTLLIKALLEVYEKGMSEASWFACQYVVCSQQNAICCCNLLNLFLVLQMISYGLL